MQRKRNGVKRLFDLLIYLSVLEGNSQSHRQLLEGVLNEMEELLEDFVDTKKRIIAFGESTMEGKNFFSSKFQTYSLKI